MNITGESSGATTGGEEKQKTFGEWLQEAEALYRECKSLVDSCLRDFAKPDENDDAYEITKSDNDLTIVTKVNSLLELDRRLKDVAKIYQAKECIDNALKQGASKKAKDLENDIGALLRVATGVDFQNDKASISIDKVILVDSLAERHKDITTAAADSSDRKVIRSKERLEKLIERCPSPAKARWNCLQEIINFEKQFLNDNSEEAVLHRQSMGEERQQMEDDSFLHLANRENERLGAINESEHGANDSIYSRRGDAKLLSYDEITKTAVLFDQAIESVRDLIEFADLLSDPQTPHMDSDRLLRKTLAEGYDTNVNTLISCLSARAFWEAVKVAKHIDSLRISEDIKNNVLRIDKASSELFEGIAACYPDAVDTESPALPPGDERNRTLLFLATSYEFLAGECHWLAESFPKKHAQNLSTLGELLSNTGEGLFKEINSKGLQNVASEAECKAFIDSLLVAEHVGPEERDLDDALQGDEESVDVSEASPSEAKQEIASAPSSVSAKERKTTATLIRDLNRSQEEKARQIRAINKDKRNLEKIEQKLTERNEEIERIKQSHSRGAHIRHLAWDLENAPMEAARFAQLAQKRTSGIVGKLNALEEITISAGGVTDERHRDDMAEYAGKAAEYENLQKHYESEGKALRIAKTKAFLGIEGVRKSNAAKRLLTELVETENGAESLNVTVCKTLPKYPQAKNRFGILETKEGQPIYDHVVEFRVEMEKIPAFLVHFHFRSPLPTGKTPDYYMERMDIHDWNVQAVQKQETAEKVRSRQLEGGQRVLRALHAAWKKSLELDREKKKEVAVSASPSAPSGKNKKGKARRR